MNDSWAKPIIEQWTSWGIKLNPGSSIGEIAEVEIQIGIHFPDDFKELYVQINGFADWDWTPNMFSLWPLSRIVEEYSEWRPPEFVGLCDYMIRAHSLGFIKSKNGIFKDYGQNEPELIAQSFSQAIHLINIDAGIIY